MKRTKRKAKPSRTRQSDHSPTIQADPKDANRRKVLLKARNLGIVAAAVGGAGWYLVAEVRATAREQDLSRIGRGIPTVVQIHDPQCPKCQALQRETREALDDFEDHELHYVVANIRTAEGRRFASQHRVRHVTLLLFDGNGNRRNTLAGPNRAKDLKDIFRNHVARSK